MIKTPRPAMRGNYSIRNPLWNFLFRSMDAALSSAVHLKMCLGLQRTPEIPNSPRRILISNIAHLGDVIVATSVLPALHAAFPQAEIGFLVGSWSLPILINHPLVTHLHVIDHWMQTRATLSPQKKWQTYRRTRAIAMRDIKALGYDMALDLYWNLPNTLLFLQQAQIPIRIGYGSAGFGPLTTHCLTLTESRDHILERHRSLLGLLSLDLDSMSLMTPTLPPVSSEVRRNVKTRLLETGVNLENYIVFHPGASSSYKEWEEKNWSSLAQELSADGYHIVFTGHGNSEELMIKRIIQDIPRCISMCGKISWEEFVCVIQSARLLACVDTVAGHVAGAVGTSSIVVTMGRNPYLWKPSGAPSQILIAPVPCAPCHLNQGCAGMECIRNLKVAEVLQACRKALKVSADSCVEF